MVLRYLGSGFLGPGTRGLSLRVLFQARNNPPLSKRDFWELERSWNPGAQEFPKRDFGVPREKLIPGMPKTICFHRVLRCRGSRSENIVIHNRNGVPFCNLAKKVIRFHWKTNVFQNAILTFHFLNFSHGETSFSGSRESRSENIVKHNETESFFVVLPRKCSVSIGKQRCFRARF